jgi:uncharacterized protein involved in tolerance to divalent cations
MVNVLIYLNSEIDPFLVVKRLLEEKIIAKATIDLDNISYEINDGNLVTKEYTIVTIQTRSSLFSKLVNIVESDFSSKIPIYSLPITQSNNWFDQYIREQTIKPKELKDEENTEN